MLPSEINCSLSCKIFLASPTLMHSGIQMMHSSPSFLINFVWTCFIFWHVKSPMCLQENLCFLSFLSPLKKLLCLGGRVSSWERGNTAFSLPASRNGAHRQMQNSMSSSHIWHKLRTIFVYVIKKKKAPASFMPEHRKVCCCLARLKKRDFPPFLLTSPIVNE